LKQEYGLGCSFQNKKPAKYQRAFPRHVKKPVPAHAYAGIGQARPQNIKQFSASQPRPCRPLRSKQLPYQTGVRFPPLPPPQAL
jgi:hypothetical protein